MTDQEIHLLNTLLLKYKAEYIDTVNENTLFKDVVYKGIQHRETVNAWTHIAYEVLSTSHTLLEEKNKQ